MPNKDPAIRARQRHARYWRKRGVEPPPFEYHPGQAGAPIRNHSEEAREIRERVRALRAGAPRLIAAKNSPEAAANRKRLRDETRARRRAETRAFLDDYKRTHPCVDCGETDPIVLTFDHRDRSDKLGNVSELAYHVSIERVKIEVAKCDVRCFNCHARKTIENQEYVPLADWEIGTAAPADWEL